MKNCGIYTRVSTEIQAEKEFNSCETQELKIRRFIESQEEMSVYKVYSDPGFTGANLDRSGMQELLNDIKKKRLDMVISYKIDRLTRSPRDFYQLVEIFDKHNVDFISVTERFDTSTPAGRLLRNIMLTFAQFERELTCERVKDKMFERAKKGMWNGGSVPVGYKAINKTLFPDESNSKTIELLFKTYTDTGSLTAAYRKSKPLLGLSKTTVAHILRKPVLYPLSYGGTYFNYRQSKELFAGQLLNPR